MVKTERLYLLLEIKSNIFEYERSSLSYPGNNVKVFVKWYNNIKKINKEDLKKIIHINFEFFFENFYKEKDRLSHLLGIGVDNTNNFDLEFTLKNFYKYKIIYRKRKLTLLIKI